MVEDALKIFRVGFPKEYDEETNRKALAVEDLKHWHLTDWSRGEFSLGAYSHRGPNVNNFVEVGVQDPLLEAQGRLRFGGEYMGGLGFGSTHGAYMAG